MAMDSSGVALAQLIINTLPPLPSPAAQAANLAYWTAICAQIIKYIQSNATVATTDTVPALGLVAPNGGGPVTGSAAGTGTGTVS